MSGRVHSVGLVVLFIGALASWFLFYEITWMWISFLVCTAIWAGFWIFTEKDALAKSVQKKTTQFGINAVVMGALVIGLAVVANMIASKYDVKLDMTKGRVHSLSEQTVNIIKGLPGPVSILIFTDRTSRDQYRKALDRYTYLSDKLKIEYVDPYQDSARTQQYGIKELNTFVILTADRTEKIEDLRQGPSDPNFEEKLTNALIRVRRSGKSKIGFLTGHQELSIEQAGRGGYSQLKEKLESGHYLVSTVSLLTQKEVPADVSMLVVAGPKSEFFPAELTALEDFLKKRAGKILMMVEPTSPPALRDWLAKFGVKWNPKKVVVERNPITQLSGGNPVTPVIMSYTSHKIVGSNRDASIMPIATPVEKAATPPQGIDVETLFSSTGQSVEGELIGNEVKDAGGRKGPLNLGLAISSKLKDVKTADLPEGVEKKGEPEFRMVVVGDSDFAANGVIHFGINQDLVSNMLEWLAQEEDLIAIRPKNMDNTTLDLTRFRMQFAGLSTIILVPGLLVLSALFVFFTRRRL